MDSPSKRLIKPKVYYSSSNKGDDERSPSKSGHESDKENAITPSKRQQLQSLENESPPNTPGFDDLNLQYCAGPEVGEPTSPTLNVKRPRLSQIDIDDDSNNDNTQLHSDEYWELMKLINELRNANKKLQARIEYLEEKDHK